MPALNYHKSISNVRNVYLSLGFMGGIVQRRFDRTKITTNNNYEAGNDGENFNQVKYSYFDGAVGMSLNSGFGDNPDHNFYVGAAYHHFNKPKGSFYSMKNQEVDAKYVVSGGVKFGVTESSYVAIEGDYYRQGTFQETIGGIMYGMKIGPELDRPDYVLHGGAYLRWNDAFIPTVKLDYRPFSIALSYDVNISKLKMSSHGRGGYELSVSYIGFLDRNNSSLNAVKCPRF
jgi:type IX secretion system PorP/SprF family membrane protein